MLLDPDADLFGKVFNSSPSKVQLPFFDTDLIPTIINTLSKAACQCFNIDLEIQPLLETEWQEIKKYINLS